MTEPTPNTFVPDENVNTVGLYMLEVGTFSIARMDDGQGAWVLTGGPRQDLNQGLRGDTFGELYDWLLSYCAVVKAASLDLFHANQAAEEALAAEIQALMPPLPTE